jgi:hypothetical protein
MADAEEQERAMRALAFLIALLSVQAAGAAGFGRLFFTPEQRAQLDADYARNARAESSGSAVLMINGIVQRRGGARIIWINGVPQVAGQSDERRPASAPVSVPGRSSPVEIKVGQKLLLGGQSAPPEAPAK